MLYFSSCFAVIVMYKNVLYVQSMFVQCVMMQSFDDDQDSHIITVVAFIQAGIDSLHTYAQLICVSRNPLSHMVVVCNSIHILMHIVTCLNDMFNSFQAVCYFSVSSCQDLMVFGAQFISGWDIVIFAVNELIHC